MNVVPDPTPSSPLSELRALDREPDWTAMESRLVAALAEVDASNLSAPASRPWWHWTAAAAVLLLAAAITYLPPSRLGGATPKTEGPQPAPPAKTAPLTPRSLSPATPPTSPAPSPRPRKPQTTAAIASDRPSAPIPVMSEFVALPEAFALPALESARIVRMDVPVTALPSYGIEPSNDVTGPVQADFLIGQDGLPRAIRLASYSPR